MTKEELKELAEMQEKIARYSREGKIYAVQSWGIQLTMKAFEETFHREAIEEREEEKIKFNGKNVCFFCLGKKHFEKEEENNDAD